MSSFTFDSVDGRPASQRSLEGASTDGDAVSLRRLREVCRIACSQSLTGIEELCRVVLDVEHDQSILTRNPKASSLSFMITGPPRSAFAPSVKQRDNRKTASRRIADCNDWEEIEDEEILQAPIVDMCVVFRGEPVPTGTGWYRIHRTIDNNKGDLSAGSASDKMYLCIKKDLSNPQLVVTGLIVILPDRGEYVPQGFTVVRHGSTPVDINKGSFSERVLLCCKRSVGNPLIDIQLFLPLQGETLPVDYYDIARTPCGFDANLNSGTNWPLLRLSYKKKLSNLEALRNDHYGVPQDRRKQVNLDVPPAVKGPNTISSSNDATGAGSKDTDSTTAATSIETRTVSAEETGSKNNDDGNSEDNSAVDNVSLPKSGYHSDDIDEVESVMTATDPSLLSASDTIIVRGDGQIAPQKKRRAMFALLTALNCNNMIVSTVATEGILSLLRETDFFRDDMIGVPSTGKTMLDLFIECICDRFDYVCECDIGQNSTLLRIIIQKTDGALTPLSIEKIFKALWFGCSCFASHNNWLVEHSDFPFPPESLGQVPYEAFLELCNRIIRRVESVDIALRVIGGSSISHDESVSLSDVVISESLSSEYKKEAFDLNLSLVSTIIDTAVDSVETNKATEFGLKAITKHAQSSISDNFWTDALLVARMLFRLPEQWNAYIIIAGLCKLLSNPIRSNKEGVPVPRDVGTKLAVTEILNQTLDCTGDKFRLSPVFGYQIRRLVFTCVLSNVPYALVDRSIYRSVFGLITTLWKRYRVHSKMEIAVIIQQLVLKMLSSSFAETKPLQKILVMEEIQKWFDVPHVLIELFLNYDLDKTLLSHWNLFSQLCEAVCGIASGIVRPIPVEFTNQHNSIRSMQITGLVTCSFLAKLLMDAAGHTCRQIEETAPKRGMMQRQMSLRGRQTVREDRKDFLRQGIELAKLKGLKKSIKFLVQNCFILNSPHEIAYFLRLYKDSFDQSDIGDYLSEGGYDADKLHYESIRYHYARAMNFAELNLESALRLYLTEGGFRMPGEGQRIDRLLSAFSKAFWEDNQSTPFCPFLNADTPFVVSYAMIMLNTDHHRAFHDTKRKQKKMSVDEFFSLLRGVDGGRDLDRQYMTVLYESISNTPIEIPLATDKVKDDATTRKLTTEVADDVMFVRDVSTHLKRSDELLRGLSRYNLQFSMAFQAGEMSDGLVITVVEAIWVHFHGIVEACLSSTITDWDVTFSCLDIVKYMISCCHLLSMKTEMMAFCVQLSKLKFLAEKPDRKHELSSYIVRGNHLQEEWYQMLEITSRTRLLDGIKIVSDTTTSVHDVVERNERMKQLQAVAKRIEKKAKLLEGNRIFLKEADLVKVSSTSGKRNTYRFFLFSDQLLYANQSMGGLYKVHEILSLVDLTIEDLHESPDVTMEIQHPKKSFMIRARDRQEKSEWFRAISAAASAVQGRQAPQSKRMSIVSRLRKQNDIVTKTVAAINTLSPQSHERKVEDEFRPVANPLMPDNDNDDQSGSLVERKMEQQKVGFAALRERDLNILFNKAVKHWTLVMEDGGQTLPDDVKLKLYGLYKHAQFGECTVVEQPNVMNITAEERVSRAKLSAWRSCRGMLASQSRVDFLALVTASFPDLEAKLK